MPWRLRKKNNYRVVVWGACFTLLFVAVPAAHVLAYELYVDKDASDGGDGTEDAPFLTIKEALDEVESRGEDKATIALAGGTYRESLHLARRIEVIGAGRQRTTIEGAITMENDSALRALVVRNSGNNAVTVASDADIEIEDVEIRGFKKIGINALPGSGKLFLRDLIIRESEGKGLYIQRGREIDMRDSRIVDNKEEGVDLRDGISGVIINNRIEGNGESGIELIIGDADLEIRGNSLVENGSSGIATQFYAIADDTGLVGIFANVIRGNAKYGVDCNMPSGGAPGAGYWKESIDLQENIIEYNGKEEINPFCRIIEAVDAEEERDNRITEDIAQTPALVPAGPTPEELARERALWEEALSLGEEHDESEKRISAARQALAERAWWQRWLWGEDQVALEDLYREEAATATRLAQLHSILGATDNPETQGSIGALIENDERLLATLRSGEEKPPLRRGILNWFAEIWF